MDCCAVSSGFEQNDNGLSPGSRQIRSFGCDWVIGWLEFLSEVQPASTYAQDSEVVSRIKLSTLSKIPLERLENKVAMAIGPIICLLAFVSQGIGF